jgi:hypothetical protein
VANWYVDSVAYAAVPQWSALATLTVGTYRRQLAAPAFGNERVFKVTAITTGITGAAEPTWNLVNNATTTDSGVTWTQITGQEAEQAASNFKAPFATIQGAENVVSAAGTIFVGDDHTDTQAATYFIGLSGLHQYFSINHASFSVPPVEADYLAGAKALTSTTNNLTLRGFLFMKGFTLTAGSGSSNASMTFCDSSGGASIPTVVLEDCTFVLGTTSTSARFVFGAASFSFSIISLINPKFTFGATGQSITFTGGNGPRLYWTGGVCPSGGSVPTNLFNTWGAIEATVRGVDFSAQNGNFFTASITPAGRSVVEDCQFHASTVLPAATSPLFGDYLRFTNCDDNTSGHNYRFKHYNSGVVITDDGAVIHTGGASDGVTSLSHKYTTTIVNGATGNFFFPDNGYWMKGRYLTTGSSKTLTINIIAFTSALPTNANMWLESEMLTTAGVPLGTPNTSRVNMSTSAGTNLTTNTEAWDSGSVAARQNSHAYSLNDQIKVATNSGRVFICTTAGTSAGSEPGGFATAVDGGSVTDSGAIFRAGWRCQLSQSFTPRVKGFLRARVQAALATGAIFNVDPKLVIS